MEPTKADQRRSPRLPFNRLVTLLVAGGEYRGASLAGLVEDISHGGLCVFFDGGFVSHGTAVRVEFEDGSAFNRKEALNPCINRPRWPPGPFPNPVSAVYPQNS